MKIKMTNLQMEQRIGALSSHAKETGKIGYAVARNLQALKNAAMPYLEIKNKLLTEYGHPDESREGYYIVDDEEKRPEFATKLNEITPIECEVDIYQIGEEAFIEWGLTSAEMEALLWMVKS